MCCTSHLPVDCEERITTLNSKEVVSITGPLLYLRGRPSCWRLRYGRCNYNRLEVCKAQAQVYWVHVLNSLGPTSGNSIESSDFKTEGSTRPQCLGRTWLEAHYCVLFASLPTWSGSSNVLYLKPCTFCARKQRTQWGCVFSPKNTAQAMEWQKLECACLGPQELVLLGMSHHT